MLVRLGDSVDDHGRGRGHHLRSIRGTRSRCIGATAHAPWRRTCEACETGHALPRARSSGVSPRPREVETDGRTRRVIKFVAGHAHSAVGDLEKIFTPRTMKNWHQVRREIGLTRRHGRRFSGHTPRHPDVARRERARTVSAVLATRAVYREVLARRACVRAHSARTFFAEMEAASRAPLRAARADELVEPECIIARAALAVVREQAVPRLVLALAALAGHARRVERSSTVADVRVRGA